MGVEKVEDEAYLYYCPQYLADIGCPIPQMGCGRETLREKALNYYRDIIYVPIQNKLLEELGMYEVKVFGIGGNNMYFTSREEILKKGKITGPCPLA